jgi:hypothetical protein
MIDPIFTAFAETAAEDVVALNAASDIVRLEPRPDTGNPPHTYDGWLADVEHLERAPDGTVHVSSATVPFTLHFPDDYCRSVDRDLQFRVIRVHTALVHPNVRGGVVCLGPHFRPGTRPRALVQQLYGICAGKIFATHHAFDADACRYYLSHLDQVRALRARPLWRRRVAGSASCVRLGTDALQATGADDV